MEQSLNERRQLLQTKIFAHPEGKGFNSYSQAVLSRLSRCHTAAIGVHHYRCRLKHTGLETVEKILSTVGQKKWNVNAKAPFGGPAQIIEYLGRYTHKVAITAHRILHIDNSNIIFKYKDYADGNKRKIMVLSHAEFLQRFEQHILPKGLVKIRHAGYLHSRDKMKRIGAVCSQLKLPAPMQRVHTPVALRLLLQTGKDITLCPVCKQGNMELVATFIYHHGCLVDAAQLRNRGSPKIKSKKVAHEKLT